MHSPLDNVTVALDALTKEIAAGPTPELYLRRCKAYATLKQLPEAFADCRQALALAPQHAGAHNYLAALYIQEGQYAEAEQEATTANTLDPNIDGIFLLVAYEGRRLTKKLDAQPTAALYNKRGVLSMQQGALGPARADFEKAIGLDATLSQAYTNLIDVLLKQALPLAAEKVLDAIADADPDYKNDKTLLIKQWCLLERKAQLAAHDATYHALTALAAAQESVPTLGLAFAYEQNRQQQATLPVPGPAAAAQPAAPAAAASSPQPAPPAAPTPAAVVSSLQPAPPAATMLAAVASPAHPAAPAATTPPLKVDY